MLIQPSSTSLYGLADGIRTVEVSFRAHFAAPERVHIACCAMKIAAPMAVPDPTGPRIPRTKASERWNRESVGLASYRISVIIVQVHDEGDWPAVLAAVFQVYPFAVFLRCHVAEYPLAGIDAKARALNMLAIEHPALAVLTLPLHPVIGTIVGYLDDLVGHDIKADIPAPRVLRGKAFVVIDDPAPDGAFRGKCFVSADRPQAFATSETTADVRCNGFRVAGGPTALAA